MNDRAKSREDFINLLRGYQAKVAGWIRERLKPAEDDDNYEQSEEYQAALEAYRRFEPWQLVDYSPVITYAKELFERYDSADKALDEKADSIIKYLGGGSALITFGALISIKADNFQSSILGLVALSCLIPSLVCAVRAVHHAITVRRPRSSATLPDVDFAVRIAEFYDNKDDIELNLYLIYYPICEAAHYRNVQKAKWVDAAHRMYRRSMALLIVPVVGIALALGILAITSLQSSPTAGSSGSSGGSPPASGRP